MILKQLQDNVELAADCKTLIDYISMYQRIEDVILALHLNFGDFEFSCVGGADALAFGRFIHVTLRTKVIYVKGLNGHVFQASVGDLKEVIEKIEEELIEVRDSIGALVEEVAALKGEHEL